MNKAKAMNRRNALKAGAAGVALSLGAPMINRGMFRAFAHSGESYSRRTMDLVRENLVIDMLGLIALSDKKVEKWVLTPGGFGEQDFQEFKKSGINIFHNAYGISGPGAHRETLEYFALLNGFIADYPQYFMRIDSVSDMEKVLSSGKIGVIIGVQNAEHFRTPDDVGLCRSMGQMVSQLTYNSRNRIGNGATERVDGGISDFGVSIIEGMNKAGMLVDVSHCGDKTTLDAFELSKKPVAITHSNCRALNDHPRLKTDDAIVKMAAQGGVMGVTAVRMFVRDREPTTVEHVVDHIDHVVKLTSIDHVGIGTDSDLWGYDDLPREQNESMQSKYKASYKFREKLDTDAMDHPGKIYDLTEALIRRGYSDDNIRAILGGNFKRMLGEVWGR